MDYFDIAKIPDYMDFAEKGSVIVFDTETTGLEDDDEVVELAVVHMRDGIICHEDNVYLANTKQIDGTYAQKVNGITDAFLKENGKPQSQVLTAFNMMLDDIVSKDGKCLLVAHNIGFDVRMMRNAMNRNGLKMHEDGIEFCDTKAFVQSMQFPLNILPNHKLATCVSVFALDAVNSHEALDDAKACLELFRFLTRR